MPAIDFVVESDIERTVRVRQLSAMFDAPVADKCRLEYKFDLPIDAADWNVGLIVGPSGSGKSALAKHLWGETPELQWGAASVVDDFSPDFTMEQISTVCQAVGFNTIPAWMRRYAVLSTGEKFRADIARRLLELPSPIVVDEFTSVVDRQVAQIGSYAIQKHIRRLKQQFVAVTCHYDVVDWLQPDWVLDMATRSWTRRALQRRPAVQCDIGRLPYSAWKLFAPYHYMTAELHRAARCYGLWADGRLAAFGGMLNMPHPVVRDIMRLSRLVTLPDWQGLGLAFVLTDALAAAYRATGRRMHTYPAHPALIRAFDRSNKWALVKKPGIFEAKSKTTTAGKMGGRPCAVFEYAGEKMPVDDAIRLLADGVGVTGRKAQN